ncbi:MAG TPA: MFS transporter [Mycobacteriales bacterium]|nr:MFS transporter [Mycobacteriales bacterium]
MAAVPVQPAPAGEAGIDQRPRTTWPRDLDRDVWVLLLGFFVTNGGYFMVIPLLTIYTTRDLGLSATVAGLVVATHIGLQKAVQVGCGLLADKLGRRLMLLAGLAARSAGLLAFLPAHGTVPVLAAAVVSAVGGAMFGPPIRAGLAARSTPENRQSLFVARSFAATAGASVGPLAGAALALYDIRAALAAAALAHLALAGLVWRHVADLGTEDGADRPTLRGLVRVMTADRLLWRFGALTVLFMVLYSQLIVALPLHAGQLAGGDSAVAAAASLFTVNALACLALQALWLPLAGRVRAGTAFGMGAAFCAVGAVAAGIAPTLPLLYAAVLVFTVGEVLAFPAADTLVADIASPQSLASYYGVFNLAWALGGSLGGAVGGWGLAVVAAHGPAAATPLWLGFLAIGAVVAVASQATRWRNTAPPGAAQPA